MIMVKKKIREIKEETKKEKPHIVLSARNKLWCLFCQMCLSSFIHSFIRHVFIDLLCQKLF